MAVKLSTQRCTDCQGALIFNKELKQYECPYCGKIYEKNYQFDKVQIDGMAGSKDLVRAVIIDLSKYDFVNAEKNLSECEKVDHNYIGTKIANLCYYFMKSIIVKDESAKLAASKAKLYSTEIQKEKNIEDDEKELYDFIDNSELFAILFITFSFSNIQERAEYVNNFISVSEIMNKTTNKYLFSIYLRTKSFDNVREILNNSEFLDKRYTLYEILKLYPDGDDKRQYIQKLFSLNAFSYRENNLVEKYILEGKDSASTKLVVLMNGYKLKMDLKLDKIMGKILSSINNEEEISEAFSLLETIKIPSDDVYELLHYCLSKECLNSEICKKGLMCLKNNGGLFEFSSEDMIFFFENSSFSNEENVQIIDLIFENFKINSKALDKMVTYALLTYDKAEESRFAIIQVLLEKTSTIPLQTLEDYFWKCNKDKKHKVEIADIILNQIGMNKSYFIDLASLYVKSNDSENVKKQILKLFIKLDCKLSVDALNHLFKTTQLDDEFVDLLFSKEINLNDYTLDNYIKDVSVDKYNSYLVSKLIGKRMKIQTSTIEKYLFSIKDVATRRQEVACILINNCISYQFNDSYSFTLADDEILGNVAQKYLLTSKDISADKLAIVNHLINKAKVKLSADMIVNRKKVSFKKYIVSKKDTLDSELNSLCSELGVYKLFF